MNNNQHTYEHQGKTSLNKLNLHQEIDSFVDIPDKENSGGIHTIQKDQHQQRKVVKGNSAVDVLDSKTKSDKNNKDPPPNYEQPRRIDDEDSFEEEDIEAQDELLRMQQAALTKPLSILDLLFIDVKEDLPGVMDKLKILITQLKQKVTQFCKQKNLLIVLKMRQFYHKIQLKLKELELRVSMPLSIGIFIL